ncbi:MAG: hypothetical protein AAFZ15_16245 [Bacteroidota bacterium]
MKSEIIKVIPLIGGMCGIIVFFLPAVSKRKRRELNVFLKRKLFNPDHKLEVLRKIIEAIYGEKPFSVKAVILYFITALIVFMGVYSLLSFIDGHGFPEDRAGYIELFLDAVLVNGLAFPISFIQTRFFINKIASTDSLLFRSLFTVVDVIASGIIFLSVGYLGSYLLNQYYGDSLSMNGWMNDFKRFVQGESPVDYRTNVYTAFFGSIWLWAYLLSTSVPKLMHSTSVGAPFRNMMENGEHPVKIIGALIIAVSIFCCVLAYVVNYILNLLI